MASGSQQVFKVPFPPSKQPTKHEKPSGRVLSSAECMRNKEEKKEEKRLKAYAKNNDSEQGKRK